MFPKPKGVVIDKESVGFLRLIHLIWLWTAVD